MERIRFGAIHPEGNLRDRLQADLETIAAALGEEAVTLEDVCEPYLMQLGYLTRTPRGRCVTRYAYEHLGMKAPGTAEASGQQTLDDL